MRHEVFEFLAAVIDHLFFWFGGIALVIIEALKKIQRTKEWAERLRWGFWLLAISCIFIATIQSWHEEYRRAEQFKEENAQLVGEEQALRADKDKLINILVDKERPIILQTTPDPQVATLLAQQEKELAQIKRFVAVTEKTGFAAIE